MFQWRVNRHPEAAGRARVRDRGPTLPSLSLRRSHQKTSESCPVITARHSQFQTEDCQEVT